MDTGVVLMQLTSYDSLQIDGEQRRRQHPWRTTIVLGKHSPTFQLNRTELPETGWLRLCSLQCWISASRATTYARLLKSFPFLPSPSNPDLILTVMCWPLVVLLARAVPPSVPKSFSWRCHRSAHCSLGLMAPERWQLEERTICLSRTVLWSGRTTATPRSPRPAPDWTRISISQYALNI